MKGKLFSLFLALTLLTLLPLPALANLGEVSCGEKNDTVLASNEDGRVSIRVTGLVTVSQQAELNVEYGADITLCPYPPEEMTALILGENVTGIAAGVFRGCTGLTELSLHETDTAVLGAEAFAGCTGLTAVTLTPGLTTLGDGVFADCTALTSVTLPEELTLTEVGEGVFRGCPIQSVTAGESWRQGDKQAQLTLLFPDLDPAQVDYYSDGGISPLVFVGAGAVAVVVVILAVVKRRGEEDED